MNELTPAECRLLLGSLEVVHIAVVTADGDPYVTPISFVLDGNRLAFRTVPGRRLDAIRSHPRVCIEASRVDDLGNWESVVAWGSAAVVEDAGDEAAVVGALFDKYHGRAESLFSYPAPASSGSPVTVAVELTEMSGRHSGRGSAPRTRPGRL